jgi:hypothetical protein
VTADVETPCLGVDAARRLTERIRLTATVAREGLEKLQFLVSQAKDGNVHVSLGYPSWTAYLSDVLGTEPLRLPREQRQELVGYLAGEGMSTRAIAPIVGASKDTVARDLATVSFETDGRPDTVVSLDGRERPARQAPVEDDDLDETELPPAQSPVVTQDGEPVEAVEPPTPRKVKRLPLPDQFFKASYALCRDVERVARLTESDRWVPNAEKIATKHRNDLLRCQDLLAQVINALANTTGDSNDHR